MFTPYGLSPNYRPAKQDPSTEISAGQRLLAKRAGASHIAADGVYCYRWCFSKVERAIWYTDHWGGWWADGELMPPDVIPLESEP